MTGLFDDLPSTIVDVLGNASAVYGDEPASIRGLFRRSHVTVGAATSLQDIESVGFGSSSPTFSCRAADLPAGAGDGDEIAVTGDGGADLGTFIVREVRPDGTGMAVLQLEVLE